MSVPTTDQFKHALKVVASDISVLDAELDQLRGKRCGLMVDARRAGLKYAEIAECLGVTKAYVHQQVSKAMKAEQNDS